MVNNKVQKIDSKDVFANKKVVLFAVPGLCFFAQLFSFFIIIVTLLSMSQKKVHSHRPVMVLTVRRSCSKLPR
jgi:hypothetical protein